jgi:ABC-2 type transport system ATP-binding protein
MNSSHLAIKLSNLNKQLDAFRLGPIDLTFEKDMVYAIVGENGSGKSSLFSIMMNALKPDTGEVEVLGYQYNEEPLVIKQKIGYASVRQFWEDYDIDRVDELVEFTSVWYDNWDNLFFWELATKFGLERSQKLRKLSTGMQQRLAIAIALAIKPDLLLLDEATNGVDFRTARLLQDEFVKFMQEPGKTIVFATHILDEIKQLADYIIYLHEGRVLGTFEKDELMGDWKAFWVEHLPANASRWTEVADINLQGLGLARIVSSDARVTESKLSELGVKVASVQALDLQEILIHLVETKFK